MNAIPTQELAATPLELLLVAERLFSAHGVAGVSTREIARAAGQKNHSAVAYHFGSKEGLAEELFIDGIARFNQGMIRKLKRSRNAEESVKDVVRYYCDWTARHRALARYLHSRNIDFSADARERLKAIHHDYITQVFGLFTNHVVSGEMRALPLDAYVPLISGPVQKFTRRWLSGQAESGSVISKDMKELFADAAWKSVRSRG